MVASKRESPPTVIHLQGITKAYMQGEHRLTVLKSIDLAVNAGEFVAIMGPSGSGKSTLMNILGCLDQPTAGSYKLMGQDVAGLSRDARARVRLHTLGFVFQGFHLLSRTTALENVELPLLYSNIPTDERRKRARSALLRVGLQGREDHTPAQLSGGQQQRVAIARALVNQPQLLLADEPTGNLDSQTSLEVMVLLQELNQEGLTMILVTHEPDIASYASRIVLVRDGQIVSDRAQVARQARADRDAFLQAHPRQEEMV